MREQDLIRILGSNEDNRCRRLVREVFEWPGHPERLASIGPIRVVERNEPTFSPGTLVLSGSQEPEVQLSWIRNDEPALITLSPERACGTEIERLETIQLAYDSPEPKVLLDRSFDSMVTARSFVRELTALVDDCYQGVEAATSSRRTAAKAIPPTQAKFILSSYLTKTVFVWFLQARGWLTYHGQKNYLQTLYDAWKEDPGSYRFYQRLGHIVFRALASSDGSARNILRPLVGDVRNLGAEFLQLGTSFVIGGDQVEPIIADEVFERLLGPEGLLRRYHPQFEHSDGDVEHVGLSYLAMSTAIEEMEYGNNHESPSGLLRQARETIEAETGGQGASPDERMAYLQSLRLYSPEAGSGAMLIALIREATKAYEEARRHLPGEVEGPTDYARALARDRVTAVDDCPRNVLRTRAGISQLLLEIDSAENPQPLPNLHGAVQVGRAIVQIQAPRMVEDEHNEFKSAFAWNSRTQQRDARLRSGVVRTVAAFLNTDGGVLWLGIDDSGRPIGLEDELALIDSDKPEDVFRVQVHEALKNSVEPLPFHHLVWEWRRVMGKLVAKVSVRASPHISYVVEKGENGRANETIYVRDGNRTIALVGRHRDQFVISRSGVSANLSQTWNDPKPGS